MYIVYSLVTTYCCAVISIVHIGCSLTAVLSNIFCAFINYKTMAKVLFLVSTMLLSFHLMEQSKLSHDNNMIDKSDIETDILKVSKCYTTF